MVWFKKRRLGYVALILSVLAFSLTGFAVVSASQPNKDIEAKVQAAVDAGEITREEADKKRAYSAEGGKRFGKRFGRSGAWDRVSPEDIEAKIQVALDAGKITQEEADEKRAYLAEGGKRFGKRCAWGRVSPEDIEAKIQAALDAGKITQEEADAKRLGIN